MTFYPCTQCQLWNDGFQEGSNLTLFRILCRHDMHTYVLSCQGCIIVVEGTHLAHWWTLQLMLLDVSICSWILWPFWGKLVVWVCLGWQVFNILFCEYAQIPYFRYHHWLSTLETFWQIRDALWWFRYAPFTFSFAYLLLIADSGRSIWLMLSSIHLWVLLGFWHFQQIAVWILSCLELLDKAHSFLLVAAHLQELRYLTYWWREVNWHLWWRLNWPTDFGGNGRYLDGVGLQMLGSQFLGMCIHYLRINRLQQDLLPPIE